MNKILGLFKTPTAEQLARRELHAAERELLAAQSAQEYAARMSDYHIDRITRLRRELDGLETARRVSVAPGSVVAA